jgi:hypothetical protein
MMLAERLGGFLAGRTTRRSFLARTTMTATALSVAPVDLLLRPGSAYAAICQCAPGTNCDCSQPCCDGYTQFCCTINNGVNACPPGTFAGGWWKADGSVYCAGARYYIDCMGECHGCGCGGSGFCASCDGLTCECALGSCGNRHVGCTEFRYGQCHQEIACSGRIACRVVSCTPPWMLDASCSTVAQTDESTANHFAPCQNGPTTNPTAPRHVVGMAATVKGDGYWLVDSAGGVRHFGAAVSHGSLAGHALAKPVVGMAVTPSGKGYWLVAADGGIFTFGDAAFDGSTGNVALARPITGMSDDPVSGGYRFVATDGGVFDFHAPFYGSLGDVHLAQPVVGMAATRTGKGYWLVAADGGIFTFGDASFHGSLGAVHLAKPVVGMAATPTGKGYWLVAADGGMFTFGDASFHGSLGAVHLAQPVVGMAATPTGKGYWLVAADGGIFTFGDARFYGSGAG